MNWCHFDWQEGIVLYIESLDTVVESRSLYITVVRLICSSEVIVGVATAVGIKTLTIHI